MISGCSTDTSHDINSTNSQIDKQFTKLQAQDSGIDFINSITDQEDFNILNYRNFYNGGGVAIGDVNNDGLEDIYFTANLSSNALYLNKGDLQFEDVTTTSGTGGERSWSNGVAMGDVNGDGWLDIYVCNSGDVSGGSKENELFINLGNGKFSEQAATWGLDNSGYSTDAVFFDFDQDGDLDCFLVNNSFKSPDKIEQFSRKRHEVDYEGGDKLYRNDGDKFTDVTLDAGIYSSGLGFGLSAIVSDLNGDMLPDIYVCNDFWERDYLYRNLGNGKFIEELEVRLSHTSLNSMGADIADLNNDGYPDIMTPDMLPQDNFRRKSMTQFEDYYFVENKYKSGYHYQTIQNSVQINKGDGSFQEVGFLSGMAATDWSWSSLMFDFENDGDKDIFVSNGIYKDLTDFDFVEFIKDDEEVKKIVGESGRADFRDYLEFMPSTKLSNYAFVNSGSLDFTDRSKAFGLDEPSFSNGAAYGDLDNDGDLDLIVNNVNMASFVYRNEADKNYLRVVLQGSENNSLGIGAKVIAVSNSKKQELQQYLSRGFQSSMSPVMTFGLGDASIVDTVKVIWPDNSMQTLTNVDVNQTLSLEYSNATEVFSRIKTENSQPIFRDVTYSILRDSIFHLENEFNDFDHELLLPYMISQEGPKILKGDVNNDKLEDFFVLGAADVPTKLYLQTPDGKFENSFQQSIFLDQALEATCGVLFDNDQDGDLDLIIGHGGNEFQKGRNNFVVRYYDNLGNGQFNVSIENAPPVGGNLSVIEGADVDDDGDMDFFVGARSVPGNYGLVPANFIVLKADKSTWAVSNDKDVGQLGMVTDASWSDIDGDADPDLVVVGEWMPITIFGNDNGIITKREEVAVSSGLWQTIEPADLDGDGDIDFVLGNWGANSLLQTSKDRPINMYVKDFDDNGKSEFIIEAYVGNEEKSYPIASKMDMSAQLPHLKSKFLKYKDYAKSTYTELLSSNERKNAIKHSITTLNSSILWNEGDSWRLEALPLPAQVSSVHSILVRDFTGDNHLDILLMGNTYSVKPEIGRQDGNMGVLLRGDGKGNFKEIDGQKSGLSIRGEVRDIVNIKNSNAQDLLLIGRNNESILVLENLGNN